MVDLKAIDARIRKLQKLKEVLADEGLRELIADPELLELMKNAVSANGIGDKRSAKDSQPHSEDEEHLPAEGSLKRKVLDTARSSPGKFTTREIVEKLQAGGHQFDRDAMIAVNQALRHLARNDRGLIRLVREGSGRIPHIYEAVRREAVKN